MVEFINIIQGGRSIHEYYLEYIKFYKYVPTLVSDSRDQMIRFVTGVSDCLQEV